MQPVFYGFLRLARGKVISVTVLSTSVYDDTGIDVPADATLIGLGFNNIEGSLDWPIYWLSRARLVGSPGAAAYRLNVRVNNASKVFLVRVTAGGRLQLGSSGNYTPAAGVTLDVWRS